MPSTPAEKKRVLARIRRIRGQVEALERAVASDVPHGMVLHQIAAVRGAVGGLMNHVLEDHVHDALGPHVTEADDRASAVREVTEILRSYLK